MKKLGLFVLLAASFLHAQSTLEKCTAGACYGFGPPSGQAANGYIYQDVSQLIPAMYCAKNGGWVGCGATGAAAFPAISNIVVNTSTTASRNAVASDVVSLFPGTGPCFLKSDGTCAAAGNVIPSPQFRMSFFPSAGTVGAVQGDAGSTTDGNGNVTHASVTTNVTNRVFSQTGSDTQNNTAVGTSGEPFGVHNFNLNFSGYGKSIGNAGVAGQDQGWRVAVGPQIQGKIFGAGIHQLFATNARKWGIGDFGGIFMCPNGFGCFSGGAVTPSDQGAQVILVSSTQFVNFYHGTVTATTGAGDTSPVISTGISLGGEAIIGGGYLINTSKTILTASLVGSVSTAWAGGSALGLLAISGGATPSTGMCQLTQVVLGSTGNNLGIPQTESFTCTTYNSLPITAGLAWIASGAGEPLEQVMIQTVSGSGTITGTMLSATPHAIGGMIVQGGTHGALSMDDDLSVLGNLTDFPVVGATDSTHLLIAFPGSDVVGLPYGGIMYQSLTGGIHVFAAARITFVGTDGLTNHVETNNVNWQVGDNIASPTPSAYLESGVAVVSTAHTQQNPGNPSLGMAVSTAGPVSLAYRPFDWSNNFATAKYVGYGGRLVAPTFLTQKGPQSNFASMDDPLGGGDCGMATLLCDLNSGSHNHDLALYIDAQAQHSITLKRSLNRVDFHDTLRTGGLDVTNNGTGTNGLINFLGFFGTPAIQYLDLGATRRIGTGITGGGIIQNWCIVGGGEAFQWINGGDMSAGSNLMTLGCDTGVLSLSGGVTAPSASVLATSTTNDLAYFDNATGHVADSGVLKGSLALLGTSNTWTAPQSFPSPFTVTGTGASISTGTASNTDLAGQLTLAAGTQTLTFAGTYASSPICVATDTTAANAVKASATTTALTLTGTGTDVVNYICIGRN